MSSYEQFTSCFTVIWDAFKRTIPSSWSVHGLHLNIIRRCYGLHSRIEGAGKYLDAYRITRDKIRTKYDEAEKEYLRITQECKDYIEQVEGGLNPKHIHEKLHLDELLNQGQIAHITFQRLKQKKENADQRVREGERILEEENESVEEHNFVTGFVSYGISADKIDKREQNIENSANKIGLSEEQSEDRHRRKTKEKKEKLYTRYYNLEEEDEDGYEIEEGKQFENDFKKMLQSQYQTSSTPSLSSSFSPIQYSSSSSDQSYVIEVNHPPPSRLEEVDFNSEKRVERESEILR